VTLELPIEALAELALLAYVKAWYVGGDQNSLSVSITSTFGQTVRLEARLGNRLMPNWSKPRNISSNNR
jgi:hypothetical protein